jgi:23S rRNA (guanosine2251-2'-O)-methyltransferase
MKVVRGVMKEEKLYGIHPVVEALSGGRRQVGKLLLGGRRRDAETQRITALAAARGVPVETVSMAQLDSLLGHRHHQGVVAMVTSLDAQSFAETLTMLAAGQVPQTVVLLDGVTDVGNFAALLRSAVAFGVRVVLLPRHRSVSLTPTVAKRSAGAVDRLVVVEVGNVAQALDALKRIGFWVYGAEMTAAVAVGRMAWPERVVLVLGGENRGLRRLVRERCDGLVQIPMCAGVDSLNVAVAGSIILAYIWDQHSAKGGAVSLASAGRQA